MNVSGVGGFMMGVILFDEAELVAASRHHAGIMAILSTVMTTPALRYYLARTSPKDHAALPAET